MDELETLFYALWEESDPKTPEFEENKARQSKLMEQAQKTMGLKWVDKWDKVYYDYLELVSKRLFQDGLRFGLKLLLLLHED